nr:hypothetical protein CFP56_34105 [Quercus suber]
MWVPVASGILDLRFQQKELLEMLLLTRVLRSLLLLEKLLLGMSLEKFLEKFAEDEENEKVATDFYPLSSDTVRFQQFGIPAEEGASGDAAVGRVLRSLLLLEKLLLVCPAKDTLFLQLFMMDIIMPLFAEPWVESFGVVLKGMSLEKFLEKFAEDKENEKVATDFYPLSSDTVRFQKLGIPAEGQSLLAAIRIKLESSNLEKALEWKNALKDLLFMKFGVQFLLDKIWATVEACIARDDEFTVKIVDLEREIAAKRYFTFTFVESER